VDFIFAKVKEKRHRPFADRSSEHSVVFRLGHDAASHPTRTETSATQLENLTLYVKNSVDKT